MLDQLFSACGALAALGWILLIATPRHPAAHLVVGTGIPVALALGYLTLVVRHMPGAEGGFGSLAEVAALFSQPPLLLAGWIHYLAFDLFIGAWQTRDAARHRVSHWLVVPCLVMTFLLGPIGLLAYLSIRSWRSRSLSLATS